MVTKTKAKPKKVKLASGSLNKIRAHMSNTSTDGNLAKKRVSQAAATEQSTANLNNIKAGPGRPKTSPAAATDSDEF